MTKETDSSSHSNPGEQINLIQFWQAQAEALLARHTRNFNELTINHRRLVTLGDDEIKAYNAMGYNIILNSEEVPFTSKDKLIFYSNYIGRTLHIGNVLTEMERMKIITADQINLG